MNATKYILHGGATIGQKENERFYQEMAEGFDNPKILLVYFSREKSDWPRLAKNDIDNFQAANPGTTFNFTVAAEKDFPGQITENDIMYFAGGSTKKLQKTIEGLRIDLKKIVENKVVSGSSAGAHLLSRWHYGHTAKKVQPGLGLLPIAVFTHYKPNKGTYFWLPEDKVKAIEEELNQKAAGYKVYFLKEQRSVVINPKDMNAIIESR